MLRNLIFERNLQQNQETRKRKKQSNTTSLYRLIYGTPGHPQRQTNRTYWNKSELTDTTTFVSHHQKQEMKSSIPLAFMYVKPKILYWVTNLR